jgi:two-component system, OmpR family, sensor histidine kinase BaeS
LIPGRGITGRIAVAAFAAAALGLVILALGIVLVGGRTFTDMMVGAGDTAAHAREMFDEAVTNVVVLAGIAALVASVALAVLVGQRLGRPIHALAAAARRVAMGDYAARVPRAGPPELVGLADSFNQMAEDLGAQERIRRDFIGNAAHELRTPLTNLKGYLEALRDGVIPADAATYDSLLEEADRLVRLSRSLDALAEGDASSGPPMLVELDLAEAVRAAVDRFRPSVDRAGLDVRLDQPDALLVHANADHLAQVLANLLSNAVRYTPRGGRVSIRVSPRSADALVAVTNTSEPIPPEDLERLFERFYRVEKSRDRAHGGAGIGLAIVKQLVEAAGGRVGAESGSHETRIWFTLPVA